VSKDNIIKTFYLGLNNIFKYNVSLYVSKNKLGKNSVLLGFLAIHIEMPIRSFQDLNFL
jgi:hypothetical protein